MLFACMSLHKNKQSESSNACEIVSSQALGKLHGCELKRQRPTATAPFFETCNGALVLVASLVWLQHVR